jgi:hypothetical protein
MIGGKGFDRAKFEEAFRIMGQYLLDRHVLGEVAIYGGSAILFQFDWRQSSEDIDARIITVGIVTLAVEQAAKELDLPRSWLDESVATYARRQEESDRTFVGVRANRVAGGGGHAGLHSSDGSRADASVAAPIRIGQGMARPQALSEVAQISRAQAADFAMALNEFTDEFYLDHPDKAAQQQRIDPVPELVGDARIGAAGEHLAQRWGLRVPAWTQRPQHFALDAPVFMPDSRALRGVLIVESPRRSARG